VQVNATATGVLNASAPTSFHLHGRRVQPRSMIPEFLDQALRFRDRDAVLFGEVADL
jgi:hypothetical protein